jgi:hypothetical protein
MPSDLGVVLIDGRIGEGSGMSDEMSGVIRGFAAFLARWLFNGLRLQVL